MKKQVLRDSVDLLKQIKTELPNNVESSVVINLEKVIADCEAELESRNDNTVKASELLLLLEVFVMIPEIAEAINYLVDAIGH